jgi:cell wall-associated NlpC family hydrolase
MEKQLAILFFILSLLIGSNGTNFAGDATTIRLPIRDRLSSVARKFLGLPYRWGGMSERHGVDCSGLIKALFAKLNINLPRTSRDQFRAGQEVSIDNIQAGDLVFFSTNGVTPDHVGLYIGDNRFVHAEKKAGQVIITDLYQPWYINHFLGARRILIS